MTEHQQTNKVSSIKVQPEITRKPDQDQQFTQEIVPPVIQQSILSPRLMSPSQILYLQRTIGNAAVQRLMAGSASHAAAQALDDSTGVHRQGAYEPGSRGEQRKGEGTQNERTRLDFPTSSHNNVTQLRGNDNGETKHNVTTLQRWISPGEDAAATRLQNNLDGIRDSVITQRDRARDLSTAVPLSLRAHWAAPRITAYQTTDNLRVDVETAIGLAQPAVRTLAQLRNDVQVLGPQLNQLKVALDTFEAGYNGYAARIAVQAARHTNLNNILLELNGAAKLAQWQNLATAVQTMNLANINLGINAFDTNIDSGTFTEGEVAAARSMAPGQRKTAIIEFLTELFASGQLRLNTWAHFYPTNWDLKTGEFGAEWHLKCGSQPWIGKKWVFHAHCETIRGQNGYHEGFRFKNILGTNHLKMQAERLDAGVQLDLPLSADTLAAMAAPYQDKFTERLQNDSTFGAVLKKSK